MPGFGSFVKMKTSFLLLIFVVVAVAVVFVYARGHWIPCGLNQSEVLGLYEAYK